MERDEPLQDGGRARAELEDSERSSASSADGTEIGFARVGSGPVPLVIVHGALSSGQQWMPVAAALAEACTCYVMDRWGRGGSEDRPDYSLEREVEDIEAVLEAAGPDAYLLGHSSGAIYTLEAALRTSLGGLILYEPPLHGLRGRFAEEIWPRIQAAAEEGRYEEAVSTFFTDEGGMTEGELAALRSTPLWRHRVALGPHSVREWEELIRVAPTVERYRDVSVPTLLLTGAESRDHPSFAARDLQVLLPDARTAVLDGQGHVANLMAPDLVAGEVGAFVRAAAT